jgi:hypothetical protein
VTIAGAGSTGGIRAVCIGKFRKVFKANRLDSTVDASRRYTICPFCLATLFDACSIFITPATVIAPLGGMCRWAKRYRREVTDGHLPEPYALR